jgi:uncharacterized protein YjbI with pentapeptide repeats
MSDFDDLPQKDRGKYKRRDKKYAANKTTSRDLFEKDRITNILLRREDLEYLQLQHRELRRVVLFDCNLHHSNFQHSKIIDCEFINCNLATVEFSDCEIEDVTFENCNMPRSTFRRSNVSRSRFTNANLSKAKMQKAVLKKCQFEGANFSQANLYQSEFYDSHFDFARFIETNFYDSYISNCSVFGSAVWKSNTKESEQINLVITPASESKVYVDNIKVAQFIYLILGNEEIREVVNTLTSKAVLILGRFAVSERKAVLNALREALREYDLLPIVFDFDRPTDRDYTETVQTLAGLSLFVIVDVTNPKSTPLEMESTVKQFKVPYLPIIDLSADQNPFSMMADLQNSFHWVLPTFGYHSKRELLENIETAIIRRAVEKHNELRIQKAAEQKILTIDDLKKS